MGGGRGYAQVNVSLTPEFKARLDELVKETGFNPSTLARVLLHEWAAKRERELAELRSINAHGADSPPRRQSGRSRHE